MTMPTADHLDDDKRHGTLSRSGRWSPASAMSFFVVVILLAIQGARHAQVEQREARRADA